MPRSETLKQRVSESRAKRVWTLPNRWSSESHQVNLNGRVVTEVGVANGICFNRRLNNANRANRRSSERKAMLASVLPSRDGGRLYVKIMAETFGHYNILLLSLSGARLQER